jgi:hypothetical protein
MPDKTAVQMPRPTVTWTATAHGGTGPAKETPPSAAVSRFSEMLVIVLAARQAAAAWAAIAACDRQ